MAKPGWKVYWTVNLTFLSATHMTILALLKCCMTGKEDAMQYKVYTPRSFS